MTWPLRRPPSCSMQRCNSSTKLNCNMSCLGCGWCSYIVRSNLIRFTTAPAFDAVRIRWITIGTRPDRDREIFIFRDLVMIWNVSQTPQIHVKCLKTGYTVNMTSTDKKVWQKCVRSLWQCSFESDGKVAWHQSNNAIELRPQAVSVLYQVSKSASSQNVKRCSNHKSKQASVSVFHQSLSKHVAVKCSWRKKGTIQPAN